MANKFQLKRTSVTGRTPNTTNSSNTSFIDAGELAVNLVDKKLFSSNGSAAFEVGSNLSTLNVSGTATLNAVSANGSTGTAGQILASNGSSIYWSDPNPGDITSVTAGTGLTGGGTSGDLTLAVNTTYMAALSVNNATYFDGATWSAPKALGLVTPNTGTFTTATVTNNLNVSNSATVTANGSTGALGQVLTSNGTGVYWAAPEGGAGSVQLKTFTYTINANTTVITGIDDNSQTLLYTANLESVYVNGVKIISGVDYTTVNATAITLATNAVSGDTVQVVAATSYNNIIGAETSANTTTTSNTVVDTFDKSVYRTAKYLIQIKANSQYHATEVLVVHDGTTAYLTEYATIFSNNDLGNVYANVNGANVELLVSPLYANSTINTARITLGV